jgi:hypothetical protein
MNSRKDLLDFCMLKMQHSTYIMKDLVQLLGGAWLEDLLHNMIVTSSHYIKGSFGTKEFYGKNIFP